MSAALQAKGYIYPQGSLNDGSGGCSSGCAAGSSGGSSVAPFPIELKACVEYFDSARAGEFQLSNPAAYQVLPLLEGLTSLALLALKTSGPISLRVNAQAARAVTAPASWPVSGLNAQQLLGNVDGVALSVTFASGDDTQAEVAARINAAAVLAGLAPIATVTTLGQVAITSPTTGPDSKLAAFTGAAATTLGLNAFAGAEGTATDTQVDGLYVQQFPRTAGITRVEVKGSASVRVLAAGT